MTAATLPGRGVLHPVIADLMTPPPSYVASSPVIDATGEIIAVVGRVWWSDRGTHDIRSIGWRAGAVTAAGGSNIDLSLQDLNTAAPGFPTQPDGVKDQTVNFDLGTLTADSWVEHTLATDRASVAHGSTLGVVWEYDAGGRLGADSLEIDVITSAVSGAAQGAMVVTFTGGSWITVLGQPVIALIAADGTVGTMGLALPAKAINTHTFNSGSTPDELANQISFPCPVTVEAVEVVSLVASQANFDINIYSGTTSLASISVDEDTLPAHTNAARWRTYWLSTPLALDANTVYRVGVAPTTANNVSLYSLDTNSVALMGLLAGANFHYWDRVDAGAWGNENTTRWVAMRLLLSQVDDGAGSGSGGRKVIRRGFTMRNVA